MCRLSPILAHFTLLLCSTIAGAQHSTVADETAADVAEGRMYVRGYCSRCHGLDAKGGQAPDLTQRVLRHGNSDEALARNIRRGIPGTGMNGFGWSDKRISQVISFLRTQQRAGQPGKVSGNSARGETIFNKHKCDVCHWTGRNGGRRGPDLSKSRGSVAYLRQALVDPAAHVAKEYHQVVLIKRDGRVVKGMRLSENSYYVQLIDESDRLYTIAKAEIDELHRPTQSLMPDYQRELSPEELDDLITFLLTLRNE